METHRFPHSSDKELKNERLVILSAPEAGVNMYGLDLDSSARLSDGSLGNLLVRGFRELRSDETLCDFTLSAGGQSFRVHKVLLAAISDYFRYRETQS